MDHRTRGTLHTAGIAAVVAFLAFAPRMASAVIDPDANKRGFQDPFGGRNISGIVGNVINASLGLVGALFFVMFLWGGVTWLTAGGDAKKVENARKTLTNAVIGVAIVMLSYIIVSNVITLIGVGAGQSSSGPAAPATEEPTCISCPS